MNCKKCGSPITDFDKFCQNCGEPNELFNGGNSAVETPVEPVPTETPVSNEPVEPIAPIVPETPVTPIMPEAPVEPVAEAPSAPVEPPIAPAEPIVQQPAPTPVMQAQAAPVTPETPAANIASTPITQPAPKKKGNGLFIALIIILSLIIIGAGIFIAYKIFGIGNGSKEVDTKVEEKVETKPVQVTETKTFDVSGYKFVIPSGFVKVTGEDGATYIGDASFYFGYSKVTNLYTYEVLKSQLSNLATEYINKWQKEGVTYVGNNEYTYAGKKFLVITFNYNSVYTDIVLTELKDGSIFSTFVYYKEVSAKESGYKKLVEFVNSGKKDDTSSFSANSNDKESINSAGSLGKTVKFE